MNEKKSKFKNKMNNNEEEFVIPNEAACSPEFAEGCFIMEDQADKELDKED
jgi:hypothetical protein